MDTRYGRVKWGKGQPRSRTSHENWRKPRVWNRNAAEIEANIRADIGNTSEYQDVDYERPRVFCASLADWLDHEAEHGWRVDLLNLIEATPHLDWLLLSKRPESWSARMHECAYAAPLAARWINGEAPKNVWVGTSVEDQKRADERIPELADVPAVVRFLSCEPLLEQLELSAYMGITPDITGEHIQKYSVVDWVIVGGESGSGARPMQQQWVRSLREDCVEAGVAFHFKQWGGTDKKSAGRELDGRTWDELPLPRECSNIPNDELRQPPSNH